MKIKNNPLALLGGLSAEDFLAQYWQKKPLLIKNAIANFSGLLSPDELAGLACEDEVQSRIVQFKKGKWYANRGPFDEQAFASLPENPTPENNWTLLVQSVNHHLPEAAALLQQFDFIPHARLDDLMVSYAPNGGGVGPHFDSYDVFLLQGQGQRLWRISEQTDLSLVEGAPLRILQNFDTTQEWLVEAGDLLYLPPQLAHWGIAVTADGMDCMTYSIGFRAPKNKELATEFYGFMQDQLNQDKLVINDDSLNKIYQDPDLKLQAHAGEIGQDMIAKVSANLQKVNWSNELIAEFLGTYLSEPKADVVFEPNKKMAIAKFSQKLAKTGIALDLKSQMLFSENKFYLNGEMTIWLGEAASLLTKLADNRRIEASNFQDAKLQQQLYEWYTAGYLSFDY